jgi:ribose 5-phosphate isomerase B
MKVVVATDHAGFPLKQIVLEAVRALQHEPLDLGAWNAEPSDYPDFAEKVGRAIQAGQAQRGIVLCGSGVGACIAANKLDSVYASVCHDPYTARQGVEHDDMNVLVLGARIIGASLAYELAHAFIGAKFQGQEPRFQRRFKKVLAIEAKYVCGDGSANPA